MLTDCWHVTLEPVCSNDCNSIKGLNSISCQIVKFWLYSYRKAAKKPCHFAVKLHVKMSVFISVKAHYWLTIKRLAKFFVNYLNHSFRFFPLHHHILLNNSSWPLLFIAHPNSSSNKSTKMDHTSLQTDYDLYNHHQHAIITIIILTFWYITLQTAQNELQAV